MKFSDRRFQSAALPAGRTLHYVREGQGPALIFIHGAMGDWRSWAPQWDAFTPFFDCVAYSRRHSFPNTNPAPEPEETYNAVSDAEDVEALMDTLGVARAILVGSSYGGYAALAAAIRMPSRVSALVAVEPPMMRLADRSKEGATARRAFTEATIAPARAAFCSGDDSLGASFLTQGIIGRAHMSEERMKGRLENAQAARHLALSKDEFPHLPDPVLAALPMPVMLMSGVNTPAIHAAIFAELVQIMTNARVRYVKDSGHAVHQERADLFNLEVLDFLSDAALFSTPRSGK